MSMSLHVVFLREKDETYHKMLAIMQNCEALNLEWPEAVSEYFQDSTNPDEALAIDAEPKEWRGDASEGYEIDVKDIPAGCVRIRFMASW